MTPQLFLALLLPWIAPEPSPGTAVQRSIEGPLLAGARESTGSVWSREWSGDLRGFSFVRVVESELTERVDRRDDVHLGLARGKLRLERRPGAAAPRAGSRFVLEMHALLSAVSPGEGEAGATSGALATGGAARAFDLSWDVASGDPRARLDIDRMSARFDLGPMRVQVGRQAITWGVNYFWPVLDLFAPFAPQRVDRDYKPGVDAVRTTISLGDFSEIDLVLGQLGRSWARDRALGALGRWHLGPGDLGLMAGAFHGDGVYGAFWTGDAPRGGVRAEISWTDVDAAAVAESVDRGLPSRDSFWRASVGYDLQLSARWNLIAEASWNGFGARSVDEYLAVSGTDRVLRGEVTSLARSYAGLSLGGQIGALWSLGAALLHNLEDGSALLQPSLTRSLSDESVWQAGVAWGFGDDGLLVDGLGSEYGVAGATVWTALKWYW